MEAKTSITALLIFLFLGLIGCGSAIKPLVKPFLPDFAIFDDNITSQGAEPVLDPDEFEKINLIDELKVGMDSNQINGDTSNCCLDLSGNKAREELAKAFAWFNKNGSQKRRNAIQERILAASNQRCTQFKNHLRQFQAEMNFGLGSATTILGGLGAIFTPASTVRALSGSAAIASGIRAEFNEDFFYGLATHVIAEGMDNKREEIYGKIRDRQNQDTTAYPIQAAVKDAVEYHGACSAIDGLEAAGDAVVQNRNPGLKQFKKVFDDKTGSLTITKSGQGETVAINANIAPENPLTLELTKESVKVKEEVIITARGGTPPYSFFVESAPNNDARKLESVHSQLPHIQKYTAGSTSEKVTIVVLDGDGNTANAVIEIKNLKPGRSD